MESKICRKDRDCVSEGRESTRQGRRPDGIYVSLPFHVIQRKQTRYPIKSDPISPPAPYPTLPYPSQDIEPKSRYSDIKIQTERERERR